jgi:hypothetical protein
MHSFHVVSVDGPLARSRESAWREDLRCAIGGFLLIARMSPSDK